MTDTVDEAFYRELIADDALLSWIGVRLEAVEPGRLELSVPYSDRIALAASTPGMGGTTHAGVLATLVDMAGEVCRTEMAEPERAVLATTNLDVSYLRPATDDLAVVGVPERVGSSMAVSDVRVESTAPDGTRKAVAVGRGSYRVLEVDG